MNTNDAKKRGSRYEGEVVGREKRGGGGEGEGMRGRRGGEGREGAAERNWAVRAAAHSVLSAPAAPPCMARQGRAKIYGVVLPHHLWWRGRG